MSVGTRENWRSDAAQWPAAAYGKSVDGWAGETWVKPANWKLLQPIMTARFTMLKQKGFHGYEGDNIALLDQGGVDNLRSENVAYAIWLADTARSMSLLSVFKNAPDLITDVVGHYDAVIAEEAYRYSEVSSYTPFFTA
ncbi:hypothetical protein HDU93_000340, partial [Gonapodya sp. JEL0774]